MRVLRRNMQTVYYATYISETPETDEQGFETGGITITYSNPTKSSWNIGVADSDSEVAMFGVHAIETIVGAAEKDGFPLDDKSILWYGITPALKQDGTTDTPHNYRVVCIKPALHTVRFYAQKVSVSIEPTVDETPPEEPEGGEDA